MIYKIIVDKQPMTNPSEEKREYTFDIEELRFLSSIHDSLIITNEEDYVLRRLEKSQYNSLVVLEEPKKEPLRDINIKLFEGDNYIYLLDQSGNKISATYLANNDYIDLFVTKVTFETIMNQTSEAIKLMALEKLDKDEFSTELAVNSEAVQIAWNKISDYIKFMIYKNNASLVMQNDNNVLMWLDKLGQHFNKSDSDTLLGDMGVKTVDENNFITFSLPIEYNSQLSDGMAWGVTTTSDGKFHPILYLKNFEMGPQQSDATYGQLELENCDLVLKGMGTGIRSGNIFLTGDSVTKNMSFVDDEGATLLNIIPDVQIAGQFFEKQISFFEDMINIKSGEFRIFDKVKFYANMSGTETLKVGGDSLNNSAYLESTGSIWGNTISCYNFNQLSQEAQKKDFEKLEDALNIIKQIDIYKYHFKHQGENEKKNIGFVIGDKYKYSEEITNENNNAVNLYSFVSICCKAIQEQQEEIEQLKKSVQELTDEIKLLKEERSG